MGWRRPNTLAAMRGVKAEGGWGVVNTEYCSIHPTSDNDAFPYCALWDSEDIISHRKMTDEVHKHGALAGVELWIGGFLNSKFWAPDYLHSGYEITLNKTHPFIILVKHAVWIKMI